MAQFNAGPGIGMYLADQGAAVIKVEPPRGGDPMREMGSTPFLKGLGRAFMVLNRNKRCIALDFRTPEGKDILLKLVERSDVFIENFRPGAAQRLGLSYEDLSALNPRLVYASVTAWGTRGPQAGRAGYDRIVQGVAGLMSRRLPDGKPLGVGISATDLATPMVMAYGVALALWTRDRTGRGQRVDGSLLHTYLALQLGSVLQVDDDPTPFRTANEDARYGLYECEDGRYINATVHTTAQLKRLCLAVGLTQLAEDPRLAGHSLTREIQDEALAEVAKIMTTAPSTEWLARLEAMDVPCGPIQETADVFKDPQVVANEMLVSVDHPTIGRTVMVAPPARLGGMPSPIPRPAPLLGEQTEEILLELGYSPEEIGRLQRTQVVHNGKQTRE